MLTDVQTNMMQHFLGVKAMRLSQLCRYPVFTGDSSVNSMVAQLTKISQYQRKEGIHRRRRSNRSQQ